MSNVTKLHLVLILVSVFFISGLVIELLYFLHCRCRSLRRHAHGHCTVADPELLGGSDAEDGFAYSKWTLFCPFCFKKQSSSRVEPASVNPSPAVKPAAVTALAEQQTVEAAVDEEEEDCDLTRWREKCLGHSRVLYTIEEEDEEEEDTAACGEEEVRHGDDVDGGVTPFYTPASSPPHLSGEGRDPVSGDMPLGLGV